MNNLMFLAQKWNEVSLQYELAQEKMGDIEAAYLASLSMRNLLLARRYVIKFIDTNAVEDV